LSNVVSKQNILLATPGDRWLTRLPGLQTMVDNETLRHISSHNGEREYVIDTFRHRELTAIGWQTVIYRLTIDDEAEEGRYEIAEETEYQGDDVLLWTNDADEVVSWIEERSGSI
jgi:hypothetical protein